MLKKETILEKTHQIKRIEKTSREVKIRKRRALTAGSSNLRRSLPELLLGQEYIVYFVEKHL